ncbi:unnamed protein product [Effrenium voratum]|nr:unnamed protein product [Effrenium voratum]
MCRLRFLAQMRQMRLMCRVLGLAVEEADSLTELTSLEFRGLEYQTLDHRAAVGDLLRQLKTLGLATSLADRLRVQLAPGDPGPRLLAEISGPATAKQPLEALPLHLLELQGVRAGAEESSGPPVGVFERVVRPFSVGQMELSARSSVAENHAANALLEEWFDAAKIPRAMSEISLMSGRSMQLSRPRSLCQQKMDEITQPQKPSVHKPKQRQLLKLMQSCRSMRPDMLWRAQRMQAFGQRLHHSLLVHRSHIAWLVRLLEQPIRSLCQQKMDEITQPQKPSVHKPKQRQLLKLMQSRRSMRPDKRQITQLSNPPNSKTLQPQPSKRPSNQARKQLCSQVSNQLSKQFRQQVLKKLDYESPARQAQWVVQATQLHWMELQLILPIGSWREQRKPAFGQTVHHSLLVSRSHMAWPVWQQPQKPPLHKLKQMQLLKLLQSSRSMRPNKRQITQLSNPHSSKTLQPQPSKRPSNQARKQLCSQVSHQLSKQFRKRVLSKLHYESPARQAQWVVRATQLLWMELQLILPIGKWREQRKPAFGQTLHHSLLVNRSHMAWPVWQQPQKPPVHKLKRMHPSNQARKQLCSQVSYQFSKQFRKRVLSKLHYESPARQPQWVAQATQLLVMELQLISPLVLCRAQRKPAFGQTLHHRLKVKRSRMVWRAQHQLKRMHLSNQVAKQLCSQVSHQLSKQVRQQVLRNLHYESPARQSQWVARATQLLLMELQLISPIGKWREQRKPAFGQRSMRPDKRPITQLGSPPSCKKLQMQPSKRTSKQGGKQLCSQVSHQLSKQVPQQVLKKLDYESPARQAQWVAQATQLLLIELQLMPPIVLWRAQRKPAFDQTLHHSLLVNRSHLAWPAWLPLQPIRSLSQQKMDEQRQFAIVKLLLAAYMLSSRMVLFPRLWLSRGGLKLGKWPIKQPQKPSVHKLKQMQLLKLLQSSRSTRPDKRPITQLRSPPSSRKLQPQPSKRTSKQAGKQLCSQVSHQLSKQVPQQVLKKLDYESPTRQAQWVARATQLLLIELQLMPPIVLWRAQRKPAFGQTLHHSLLVNRSHMAWPAWLLESLSQQKMDEQRQFAIVKLLLALAEQAREESKMSITSMSDAATLSQGSLSQQKMDEQRQFAIVKLLLAAYMLSSHMVLFPRLWLSRGGLKLGKWPIKQPQKPSVHKLKQMQLLKLLQSSRSRRPDKRPITQLRSRPCSRKLQPQPSKRTSKHGGKQLCSQVSHQLSKQFPQQVLKKLDYESPTRQAQWVAQATQLLLIELQLMPPIVLWRAQRKPAFGQTLHHSLLVNRSHMAIVKQRLAAYMLNSRIVLFPRLWLSRGRLKLGKWPIKQPQKPSVHKLKQMQLLKLLQSSRSTRPDKRSLSQQKMDEQRQFAIVKLLLALAEQAREESKMSITSMSTLHHSLLVNRSHMAIVKQRLAAYLSNSRIVLFPRLWLSRGGLKLGKWPIKQSQKPSVRKLKQMQLLKLLQSSRSTRPDKRPITQLRSPPSSRKLQPQPSKRTSKQGGKQLCSQVSHQLSKQFPQQVLKKLDYESPAHQAQWVAQETQLLLIELQLMSPIVLWRAQRKPAFDQTLHHSLLVNRSHLAWPAWLPLQPIRSLSQQKMDEQRQFAIVKLLLAAYMLSSHMVLFPRLWLSRGGLKLGKWPIKQPQKPSVHKLKQMQLLKLLQSSRSTRPDKRPITQLRSPPSSRKLQMQLSKRTSKQGGKQLCSQVSHQLSKQFPQQVLKKLDYESPAHQAQWVAQETQLLLIELQLMPPIVLWRARRKPAFGQTLHHSLLVNRSHMAWPAWLLEPLSQQKMDEQRQFAIVKLLLALAEQAREESKMSITSMSDTATLSKGRTEAGQMANQAASEAIRAQAEADAAAQAAAKQQEHAARQEADHPATQPTQQQEVTSPISVHEPARHPSVAASAASPQAVKPHGDSARSFVAS